MKRVNHGITSMFIRVCMSIQSQMYIGHLAWVWNEGVYPKPDLKYATSLIGLELIPAILPTISNPLVTRRVFSYEKIDAAIWEGGLQTLVMAVNMEPTDQSLVVPGVSPFSPVEQILNLGVNVTRTITGELMLQMGMNASIAFFV